MGTAGQPGPAGVFSRLVGSGRSAVLLLAPAAVLLPADAGLREWWFSVALVLALVVGAGDLRAAWPGWRVMAAPVAGLVLAEAASWFGGWGAATPLRAAALPAAGLATIAGFAALVALVGRRVGGGAAGRAGGLLLALVVTVSIALYVAAWQGPSAGEDGWWDWTSERLLMMVPTRLLVLVGERVWWEHTNIAAWWFALGAVLCGDAWIRGAGGRWRVGILVAGCACALALTASRSGYLVLGCGLAAVAAGRPWRRVAGLAALVGLGLLLALGCLQWRRAEADSRPDYDEHVSGLVRRRDAGRMFGYRAWADGMRGHWVVGRGLAATRMPVSENRTHEHSIYLATVRGGGVVALAGQLALVAVAGVLAVRRARRGQRVPALLWVVGTVGFLFDRSSVFRPGAQIEFLGHWAAVWVPLLWPWPAAAPTVPPARGRGQ